MLSKHSTDELHLGTSHMALVTTSRAVTALEGAGVYATTQYKIQQGRILGNGGDRCLSHLHTPNLEARATLTIYHPLALEHLQVNQLLQRNQKIPVSPGLHASTQMEDLYYIPHDSSADNKPRLWGHTVLFPTTKSGKARP